MLIDRSSWKLHLVPFVLAMVTSLVPIAWYSYRSWLAGFWLGGGSLPALVLGTVAALIIFFEMGLWPRKALRRMRLIPAKYWMSAHIWFGIACLPMGIFHSGFHWGGWLSTLLLCALVATVVSGGLGLALQQFIPRWLLQHVPGETIYGEIDNVSTTAVKDADQLLLSACGPRESVMTMHLGTLGLTRFRELIGEQPDAELTRVIMIGAQREVGKRQDRAFSESTVPTQQDDPRSLWSAYDEVRPFLLDGKTRTQVFGNPARATGWFKLLRQACSPEAEGVIGPLERLVDQRRQFNLQRRLHWWLHAWLPFHIGLSIALSVLLVSHIYFALRYW